MNVDVACFFHHAMSLFETNSKATNKSTSRSEQRQSINSSIKKNYTKSVYVSFVGEKENQKQIFKSLKIIYLSGSIIFHI